MDRLGWLFDATPSIGNFLSRDFFGNFGGDAFVMVSGYPVILGRGVARQTHFVIQSG